MNNCRSLNKNKTWEVISNLSVTILANLISLIGSVILTFLLPKFIGITEYGYYQLYIFYASYLGFLGFGWHEGIYLRLGGAYYKDINKPLFKSQWKYYSFMEILVGFLICMFGIIFGSGIEKSTIYLLVGLCVMVYLPRAFLHNILQATNNVKAYAIGIIIEKSVHAVITIGLLCLHSSSFLGFVISEVLGRACAAVYIFIVCKDIIFAHALKWRATVGEIIKNMKAGINLMLANIASLLIIGIVRQAIEIQWDVETFGKVSLTLSVSNLLMVFVRAVSTTLFPMLRRTNAEHLNAIYAKMRTCLMIPLLSILVFCYPIQKIVSLWLPQYADTLRYMAILFPLCIFESKSSMLVETFMKTLRKERTMLYMNSVTVLLSFFSTLLLVFGFHNLDAAIFSIVVLVTFRSVFGELLLAKESGLSVTKNIIYELTMTVFFILFNWFIGGWKGCILYVILLSAYLLVSKTEIISIIELFKSVTTPAKSK